jgi:PAS domain S-box-containing protein
MLILKTLWFEITNPRVAEESLARQEYLTRVIYMMISVGLILMTIIVFAINYWASESGDHSIVTMMVMDLLIVVGWYFIGIGYWRLSGIFLPTIFLAFSGYMIFTIGPVTTAVLQLAIAILLAGMLLGNLARWIMLLLCILVYLVAGWGGGEHDIDFFLTSGVLLFMSLAGIALLEWFFSNLLSTSLRTVSEREAELKSIFRAAPIGIGMVVNRVIHEANDMLCQMTGYAREELIGKDARFLYPTQEDYDFVGSEKYRQIREHEVGTVETRWCRNDGAIRDILLSSVPLNPNDWSRGVTFSALDITERKQAEDKQKALLREKEILLAEVHHRVKNNMQVITSLLSLQAEEVSEVYTRKLLEESRNRIHSMALVHEQLYRSGEYASIDFAGYINQLASTLFSMYQIDFEDVQFLVESENVKIDLEKAIPCGLLLNELITNSLKYAFPEGRKGNIWVKIRFDDEKMILEVGDDGIGLPANFDFQATRTLGLQLVHLLVNHDLHGSISHRIKQGTQFLIEIPPPGFC